MIDILRIVAGIPVGFIELDHASYGIEIENAMPRTVSTIVSQGIVFHKGMDTVPYNNAIRSSSFDMITPDNQVDPWVVIRRLDTWPTRLICNTNSPYIHHNILCSGDSIKFRL